MALANTNAVKYAELTDEHITDIKKGIELFVKSEEYWDRFAHHSIVPRGHKKFQSRRLIRPKVKYEDISPRAELVAPRPTKIAVATFEKSVDNYGDKAIYTREDLQYHFDNTLTNIRLTLQEIAVQKLNLIKGHAFISSRATLTWDTNYRTTLRKGVKILRRNNIKRWDGRHYLVHMTMEELSAFRIELASANEKSERLRVALEGVDTEVDVWEDWMISVPWNDDQTLYKSSSVQYMVLMGKRGIDGESPVDVAKLEGESNIDVFDNGLGSGILEDVDGNYTTDDNKQQGSVAINMDGLGAAVSDDLGILVCEVTIGQVQGSSLANPAGLTGYVSHSGNEQEITLTPGTHKEFEVVGIRHDSTANKDYASRNTIVSVQVKGASGYNVGTSDLNTNTWSATYKKTAAGDSIACEIIGYGKKVAGNDTIIVRIPNEKLYSLTIASTATANAN